MIDLFFENLAKIDGGLIAADDYNSATDMIHLYPAYTSKEENRDILGKTNKEGSIEEAAMLLFSEPGETIEEIRERLRKEADEDPNFDIMEANQLYLLIPNTEEDISKYDIELADYLKYSGVILTGIYKNLPKAGFVLYNTGVRIYLKKGAPIGYLKEKAYPTRNADYVMSKIIDPTGHSKKAQIGVDLTVDKIEKIEGVAVFEGDSKLNREQINYIEAPIIDGAYHLEPNSAYVMEFEQGLQKLADDEYGLLYTRSSFNRVGVRINSPVWDPGFETNKMGTTIYTGPVPVHIPKGTRICQFVIHSNEVVEEAYNGQWQNVANHN